MARFVEWRRRGLRLALVWEILVLRAVERICVSLGARASAGFAVAKETLGAIHRIKARGAICATAEAAAEAKPRAAFVAQDARFAAVVRVAKALPARDRRDTVLGY